MGWSNVAGSVLQATTVIISGTGSNTGIFVYSGPPANGNLIGSWTGASGTDPYGNTFPAGINVAQGSISGTTFNGTDFLINTAGMFFYNGTPALHNIMLSIAPSGGTDPFGNVYPQGFTFYDLITGAIISSFSALGGLTMTDAGGHGVVLSVTDMPINVQTDALPVSSTAAFIRAFNGRVFTGQDTLFVSGPRSTVSVDNKLSAAQMLLTQGNASDAAIGQLVIDDTSGTPVILSWTVSGVTAKALTVTNDASVGGTLSATTDLKVNSASIGRGIMAAALTTTSNSTTTSGTTETFDAVLGFYQFTAVSGRRYMAVLANGLGSANTANDLYILRIRDSGSASNPTSASTAVALTQWLCVVTGGPGQTGVTLQGSFVSGSSGTHTIGVSATRVAGTGTFNVTSGGLARQLFVVDLGAV